MNDIERIVEELMMPVRHEIYDVGCGGEDGNCSIHPHGAERLRSALLRIRTATLEEVQEVLGGMPMWTRSGIEEAIEDLKDASR